MDTAYISGLTALGGSVVGALASFMTTWITISGQERAKTLTRAMLKRENLYGDFIEQASRLFTDALGHELDDVSKLVQLYALTKRSGCSPRRTCFQPWTRWWTASLKPTDAQAWICAHERRSQRWIFFARSATHAAPICTSRGNDSLHRRRPGAASIRFGGHRSVSVGFA